MTQPLSPAAQAVLDAFNAASDGHYINGEWIQDHPGQIAAALRAAADQVVLKCPEPKWNSGAEQARWFACNDVRDHLLAIAAELEGGTRDPLEPNDLSHLSEEEFQGLAPQGYHGV